MDRKTAEELTDAALLVIAGPQEDPPWMADVLDSIVEELKDDVRKAGSLTQAILEDAGLYVETGRTFRTVNTSNALKKLIDRANRGVKKDD
jgi:hypothetical protein